MKTHLSSVAEENKLSYGSGNVGVCESSLTPAHADCEVRSVIKFVNAQSIAHRNSSSAVPGLWSHTARRSTPAGVQLEGV